MPRARLVDYDRYRAELAARRTGRHLRRLAAQVERDDRQFDSGARPRHDACDGRTVAVPKAVRNLVIFVLMMAWMKQSLIREPKYRKEA